MCLRRATYHQLLARFSAFYSFRSTATRGRPPKLRYMHQVLGLLLSFYIGSMENSKLCMVFGVPPATLSQTMRKAERALSLALQGYAPARICFPSSALQGRLTKLVEAREPLFQPIFGFIDGKNLRVRAFFEWRQDPPGHGGRARERRVGHHVYSLAREDRGVQQLQAQAQRCRCRSMIMGNCVCSR
jgi:hypothetical protein